MRSFHVFHAVALLICLFFSSSASAVIDNEASIVSLRTNCSEGGTPVNNCFTSISTLTGWITNTRNPRPSADNPLQVNIGPGTFAGFSLTCDPANGFTGNISLVGAGREQTILGSPMTVHSCTGMNFSNLQINTQALTPGNYGYITWSGGGTSTWHNVDVIAAPRAWDEGLCSQTKGKHSWFGSTITAIDSGFTVLTTYTSRCDESWFYGSEISAIATGVVNGNGKVFSATNAGEVHVYGSVIRAISDATANTSGTGLFAVGASSGGMVHIHGTGIDVISSVPNNILALYAATGGSIHANAASYNLSTASGTVTRILKDQNVNTHVHAPYLWEEHPTPPNITSVTGSDMAVVTDGAQPHLLIYSSNCTSKWFDTSANACRP